MKITLNKEKDYYFAALYLESVDKEACIVCSDSMSKALDLVHLKIDELKTECGSRNKIELTNITQQSIEAFTVEDKRMLMACEFDVRELLYVDELLPIGIEISKYETQSQFYESSPDAMINQLFDEIKERWRI
mgnify:CR=1 FL=1